MTVFPIVVPTKYALTKQAALNPTRLRPNLLTIYLRLQSGSVGILFSGILLK